MSNARHPTTTIPVEECPAVQDLLSAEEAIEKHISRNRGFYETLKQLVEVRNAKLEAADKEVRPTNNSCGPFHLTSCTEKINAEKLFEELGPDIFAEVGGYTETVVDYKVDRARFLAHAARGDIPAEVHSAAVKVQPSYKAPNPYMLP